MIETTKDILDCLSALPETQFLEPEQTYTDPPVLWRVAAREIESAKTQLLGVLSPTPSPRDDIIRASGLPTPIVNAALLEMELNAEIAVEADGRISILY